ncbi:uncharacterized protein TrAtP1_001979 [Trichoderma atroviride]|uniref:uncharacterized protein n=1 Tax=Hypocrea atroviridis TaxID=63577 RepID=UPI003333CD6C|nr:hypothetical protein TrAtP1_001979 [Trichoderma atroviride]
MEIESSLEGNSPTEIADRQIEKDFVPTVLERLNVNGDMILLVGTECKLKQQSYP